MKRKTGTAPEIEIEHGSGNVWIDLGFSPAEAQNLGMRSEVMMALDKFISRHKLTQAQAARLLKVSQPRVSDLVRGQIDRFTLDSLIKMALHAGLKVDLQVKMPSGRAA